MIYYWLFSLLFLSQVFGGAHPYQIVVVRHAEKMVSGIELDGHLSSKGQRRAAYLVDFLLNPDIIDQEKHEIAAVLVPTPYGNKDEQPYYYFRTTQTIIPLYRYAQFHRIGKSGEGVYFIDSCLLNHPQQAFQEIMGRKELEDKTVVVCWEHDNIPLLFDEYFSEVKPSLKHLGENRFDMVWVVRFEDGGPKGYTFYQENDL